MTDKASTRFNYRFTTFTSPFLIIFFLYAPITSDKWHASFNLYALSRAAPNTENAKTT